MSACSTILRSTRTTRSRCMPPISSAPKSGTGIVHTAPAYGVDDLALGQANGLPVVHGVGLDGNFVAEVEPVAGMFFKDADKPLIRILKDRGMMFRSERITHSYPFGWRTGTRSSTTQRTPGTSAPRSFASA